MIVECNCEICGKHLRRSYPQERVPNHFFCSRECQNEWQKTREDLVLRNKDPDFRKKVSQGLKRRKQELKDNYHSPETKKKIGAATKAHWESYSQNKKDRLVEILRNNASSRRTFGTYDTAWNKLSSFLRKGACCQRCGSREKLHVHHLIPASQGGTRDFSNLVVLCSHCHRIVESASRDLFSICEDWELVRCFVKGRLIKTINDEYSKYEAVGAESSCL